MWECYKCHESDAIQFMILGSDGRTYCSVCAPVNEDGSYDSYKNSTDFKAP